MITHKEAIANLTSADRIDLDMHYKYIKQQEKKDKLLELYQKRKELQNYRGEHPEEYYEVDAKIEALEEELNNGNN
jgi:hypothetical protein